MALRKRRNIRADLSLLTKIEQAFAILWTRADQLQPGTYIRHDEWEGVVIRIVPIQIGTGKRRVEYYNIDGVFETRGFEGFYLLPVIPWPDRAGNKAIRAYQLHVEPVPATQPPPVPVSSSSGLPMPPLLVRAETLQPGDRVHLTQLAVDVFRIIEITNIVGMAGEDCYQIRSMNETTGDIIASFRDRGAMVTVVELATPMAFYLGMPITIEGISGRVTLVSITDTPMRVRIRWISDYINSTEPQQTAEFEVAGVIGDGPF